MPNGIDEEGARLHFGKVFAILHHRETSIMKQEISPTVICEHGNKDVTQKKDIVVDNKTHKVTQCNICGHINVDMGGAE